MCVQCKSNTTQTESDSNFVKVNAKPNSGKNKKTGAIKWKIEEQEPEQQKQQNMNICVTRYLTLE